jgi:hypothetical protein
MDASNKQQSSRRIVSFAESGPTVHIIPRARDTMSRQEIESVWYSQDDFDRILQDCQLAAASGSGDAAAVLLLALPADDGSSAEETTTMRGVELMTPKGLSLATLIQEELVPQVLKEQARLRQQQVHDGVVVDISEALAAFQRQRSTHRQRIAHLRGLSDAQAVDSSTMSSSNSHTMVGAAHNNSSNNNNNNNTTAPTAPSTALSSFTKQPRRISNLDRRQRRSERLLLRPSRVVVRTGSNRSLLSAPVVNL